MIEPLTLRVVVAVLRRTNVTEGGLHKPETADDRPHRGRVLAVADDITKVAVDDVVMFGRYAGIRLETDDTDERYLLQEDELLARVPKEPGWVVTLTALSEDGDEHRVVPAYTAELDDVRIVAEEDRMLLGGVLSLDVPDDFRRQCLAAGFVRVEGGLDSVETPKAVVIWKADAASMFGSDGRRFAARATDDSAGKHGGSEKCPLGYVAERQDRGATATDPS